MRRFSVAAAAMLLAIAPAPALDGRPAMHDPSTVIEAGGRFYAYGTGNGLPAFQSEDGWTWRRTGFYAGWAKATKAMAAIVVNCAAG